MNILNGEYLKYFQYSLISSIFPPRQGENIEDESCSRKGHFMNSVFHNSGKYIIPPISEWKDDQKIIPHHNPLKVATD